ncbi:MAG: hypothetical protein QXJ06_02295 [Candidatus Aenigmatarchaeota archaeon]
MADDGSIYVHIDCKVGHYLILMDDIFGKENFRKIKRTRTIFWEN